MTSHSKIQFMVFWFIYSLHIRNIISPDIVIQLLDLIKDLQFIDSYASSSIKNKYNKYITSGLFPFHRITSHLKSQDLLEIV